MPHAICKIEPDERRDDFPAEPTNRKNSCKTALAAKFRRLDFRWRAPSHDWRPITCRERRCKASYLFAPAGLDPMIFSFISSAMMHVQFGCSVAIRSQLQIFGRPASTRLEPEFYQYSSQRMDDEDDRWSSRAQLDDRLLLLFLFALARSRTSNVFERVNSVARKFP